MSTGMNAVVALSAALGIVMSASAEFLPIVNPSFEETSRPLAIGELTNGAGGAGVPVGTKPMMFSPPQFDNLVEVPGWRTYLPPENDPEATLWAGVLSVPNIGDVPYLDNADGQNVAQLHHHWMQQTLNVHVQPNTHYRLTFLAGTGFADTHEGIYVSMLAAPDLETLAFPNVPGVTELVRTQGLYPPLGSVGHLLPWELEFTTPETISDDLAQSFLAISFIGSDGIPRTNFDDFKLEATTLPSPAGATLLLAAAGWRGIRRRT